MRDVLQRRRRYIAFAKWLDAYLVRPILVLLALFRNKRERRGLPESARRVLFIKFWGMGSLILSEPALAAIRRLNPGAELHVLTLEQNRALTALLPHVHRTLTLPFDARPGSFRRAAQLISLLRRYRYDVIIDAEFYSSISLLFAYLSRPVRIAGFSRPGTVRSRVLDIQVLFRSDRHVCENFFRLVCCAFGLTLPIPFSRSPRLQVPPSEKRLRGKRENTLQPFVVVNVNASALALERRWPRAYFVTLCRWLLHRYNVQLVFIGTGEERAYTRSVVRHLRMSDPASVHNAAGRLSLPALTRLLCRASLMISNDSGPLHLAAALGCPVVGIYGPETPRLFGPVAARSLVLYLDLPCSPCMSVDNAKTVRCTHRRRCTRKMRPSLVIPKLRRFIDARVALPQRLATAT